ncbi:Ig-like domain repeat protein, partial [Cellulomonas sp. P5_C6]
VSPLAQPTPSGAALSAMTAGGDFSIGWAFTKFGNTVVGSQHFVHIHVAPGGVWSYTQVAAALAATTTTLTAPATAAENAAVSLSAAVAPAAATGSVEYYDGATLLGTSPVGTPFNVAAGFAAGSHSLTAKYLGDASYSPSTSAPSTLSVAGTPVGTTTSVSATSASGYALDPAVLSATVVAANSTTPTGSVTFTGSVDGGAVQNLATVPVGAGGVASITKNGLSAGTWTINASFVGTGLYTNSSSTAAATLVLTVNTTGTSSTDVQDVDVTIPAGAIEITTPYQGGNVFHLGTAVLDQVTSTYSASAPFPNAADAPIKITDTRAGQLGFTAKVTASDFVSTVDATKSFPGSYAGLTGLVATVPSGNGFQIGSLHTTNNPPLAPGLGSAVPFAQYDAGHHPGTVEYRGVLSLAGVPTSVIGGLYTATVTFTAS